MSLTILIGFMAGMVILDKAIREHRKLVRIDWKSVVKFLRFMAAVTILRSIAMSLTSAPEIPVELASKSPLDFWHVFWEDAFFVLPILMWEKIKSPSKWLVYPVLGLSALVFASAHLYQGISGFIFAFVYLALVSYRYGKKNGLGTVMVCHVLYDMITFWTVSIALGK